MWVRLRRSYSMLREDDFRHSVYVADEQEDVRGEGEISG